MAVVAIVAVGVVLSGVYWDWLQGGSGNGSNAADVRNIALVVGGIVAILLALWRSLVAERQARAAQEQVSAAQEQSETAKRVYVNERYRQAASMLGDRELPVRLGGIFALERLAEDHTVEFRPGVVKLLLEFLRAPPTLEEPQPKVFDGWPSLERPAVRPDVQAAFTAINNLKYGGVSTEDAWSHGWPDLHGAQLCSVNMERLSLRGANLQNANLEYAQLSGTDLTGASLQGANFRHANLGFANLSGCDMSGADFSGVEALRTKFKRATMPATMVGASLFEADCTEAIFPNTDLTDARLDSTNLTAADLRSRDCWFSTLGMYETEHGGVRVTQDQLDDAVADPKQPPILPEFPHVHEQTGMSLVWRGRPPESSASETR